MKLMEHVPMNSSLNEQHSEFRIHIFAIQGKVLVDSDGLLHEVVEILWVFGRQVLCSQDTDNLITGDLLDLSDTVRITEDNANL